MKATMITPHYHQPRGNTVTVRRISEGLRRSGIETHILSVTSHRDYPELPAGTDIAHGFNAYEFALFWRKKRLPGVPYIITMTGTDLNHHLLDAATRSIVAEALSGAEAVHVFNEEAKALLWKEVPETQGKTHLIPQGITAFPSSQHRVDKEDGTFVFLLPAGIRKVKNVPEAIRMLEQLHRAKPRIRLWLAGPVIEETEGRIVAELAERHRDWIRYFGQMDHESMGELYRRADVVLNSSLSEGQSSAVLEAMAARIPVLVSDIPGNRDVVIHGRQGFLYRDETSFIQLAELLMKEPELRKALGAAGHQYVNARHSADQEAKDLTAVYRMIAERRQKCKT